MYLFCCLAMNAQPEPGHNSKKISVYIYIWTTLCIYPSIASLLKLPLVPHLLITPTLMIPSAVFPYSGILLKRLHQQIPFLIAGSLAWTHFGLEPAWPPFPAFVNSRLQAYRFDYFHLADTPACTFIF